jgi:hypothetical protein
MKKTIIIAIVTIFIIGSGVFLYFKINETTPDNNTQDENGNNNNNNDNDGTNNNNNNNDNDNNNDDTENPNNNNDTENPNNNDGTTDGTNNPPVNNTVKTGAQCSKSDYIKLSDDLVFCINTNGTLNVKATSDSYGASATEVFLYAAKALLQPNGANITFNEKIKNIGFYNAGDSAEIDYLGQSILVTESGKVHIIDNNALYSQAKLNVLASVELDEKIISFTSPDKTLGCVDFGDGDCRYGTTIKTSSNKVYILYSDGSYVAK